MNTEDTFVITNIEDFATILIRNATEELSLDVAKTNNVNPPLMSTNSIKHIISKYTFDLDANYNPILKTDVMEDLFDEVCEYMFQVHLAKLCGEDKIECAWDDDSNEMVFWSKQDVDK